MVLRPQAAEVLEVSRRPELCRHSYFGWLPLHHDLSSTGGPTCGEAGQGGGLRPQREQRVGVGGAGYRAAQAADAVQAGGAAALRAAGVGAHAPDCQRVLRRRRGLQTSGVAFCQLYQLAYKTCFHKVERRWC